MTTPAFADAFACTTLLSRFAQCVDGRDYDGVLDLVSPDCIWRGPNDAVGRAAIRARLDARPTDLATLHIVSNVAVTVHDAGTASSRSYLTVYRFDGVGPADAPFPLAGPSTLAVYDDRFVRIDGRWLFAERRMTPVAQTPVSPSTARQGTKR